MQRDTGRAVKAFIDEMNKPPAKVMVLGPTYSSEAVVIGDVSKYMDLVEVILSYIVRLAMILDLFYVFFHLFI